MHLDVTIAENADPGCCPGSIGSLKVLPKHLSLLLPHQTVPSSAPVHCLQVICFVLLLTPYCNGDLVLNLWTSEVPYAHCNLFLYTLWNLTSDYWYNIQTSLIHPPFQTYILVFLFNIKKYNSSTIHNNQYIVSTTLIDCSSKSTNLLSDA